MAEFGTPIRSVADDANAGRVNPPAKRTVGRTELGTSNKRLSPDDRAVAQIGSELGSALGDALSKMVEGNTATINEQRQLDASARQGINTSVNAVDKVKQRTGWEKAVFGENIEYRAAQQRAVQNKVQASYLEDLATVDTRAGETPEEFHKIQSEKSAEILKQYDDDPDTRRKVQSALLASTDKLANAHYKAHYAHNQMQQRESERVRIQQTFDQFNKEAENLFTPEEQATHMSTIKAFFEGSSKPEGMNSAAHKELILEVVRTNMKAGNSAAMLATQALGLTKGFTAGQQAQWDVAVDAYDTKFSQKADLIRTNADIQIADALTPEQVDAAVTQKETDLLGLFETSSGSQRSALVMARGNLDISKDQKQLRQQGQARDEALKKAGEEATTQSDKDIIANVGIAKEDMMQAIDLTDDVEEKQAAIDAYNEKVASLVLGLSPEVANILKKEKLDTAASTAQQAVRKEKNETLLAAAKKKKELADKAARDSALSEYFSTNSPERKAALNHDNDFQKKEKEQAFDTHLIVGAQAFTGGELPPTAEEFGVALTANPKLQSWVLSEMKRTGETSQMLKTMLAAQSVERLFDEDGNVSQVGKDTVQMVDKLLQSDKGVDLLGGKDKHRQWKIIAAGVKSGAGMSHIQKKVDSYNANKGKGDAAGFSWKEIIGDGTRAQFATSKLQEFGVPNPSRQQITDFLYDYQLDLVAFGYDTQEANNSAWQRVNNGTTKVFNNKLHNAKYLDDATKWNTEGFINMAEKRGHMLPLYNIFRSEAQKSEGIQVTSQKQLPNLRWYTEPGVAGIFATTPSSNEVLFMSVKEMQDIAQAEEKRIELQKRIDNERGEIAIRAWEAQEEAIRIARPAW